MRIIKLPHLPSERTTAQPGDLLPDVWYKGKEFRTEQTQVEQHINMKNIVIFGAPGSGKGTQSDKLIEKYGLEHISTGDVLRSEIKNGTELGKTAQQYIDQGQLIPDELMVSMFPTFITDFNALLQPECRKQDGGPLLTPSMRIFALIRLGIKDNQQIAKVLNLSYNTVLNYRVRTRGSSINPEQFEQDIMSIGQQETA